MTATTEPHRTTFRLPPRFYEDHVARDLPAGELVRETSKAVIVRLSEEERSELRDDAHHYATEREYRRDYPGLVASARATLRALDLPREDVR